MVFSYILNLIEIITWSYQNNYTHNYTESKRDYYMAFLYHIPINPRLPYQPETSYHSEAEGPWADAGVGVMGSRGFILDMIRNLTYHNNFLYLTYIFIVTKLLVKRLFRYWDDMSPRNRLHRIEQSRVPHQQRSRTI